MSWMAVPNTTLNLRQGVARIAVGIVSFHLAYNYHTCSFLILLYLYALAALARQGTNRRAFYLGLAAGLLSYAPQLSCFYTIFGPAAFALWVVLAFWIGLFGLLARLCFVHFGPRWAAALIPVVWTGLEYFRSEIYYLRFSWLNAGYAFSEHTQVLPFGLIGVYGIGFLLMLLAGVAVCRGVTQTESWQAGTTRTFGLSAFRAKGGIIHGLALAGLGIWTNYAPGPISSVPTSGLAVAGVQMEFPNDPQVLFALSKLKKEHPEASLLVLSEYTFTEALPDMVKKWCRDNRRYLLVGAKDFVSETKYFNTAFVVDPQGEIVFRQAKSVPIQFFNDGLPARRQTLWDSPWGKIGICICYDLSYTQVTDRLVRMGAEALIVPTMDVVDWGRRQHELHARIAPIRAAEYSLPIFRVASSGISQLIDAQGRTRATAPFAGEEAMIAGQLDMGTGGHVPLDRFVARCSAWASGLLVVWLALDALRKKLYN